MNKHCYRVIFSKAKGKLVVVSEATRSQSKNSANGSGKKAQHSSDKQYSLSKLCIAILCSQSLIYTQAIASETQIKNTASNIPTSQRATLLKASNGTPIVNIRTPNSNGVSHNTYNQLDIGNNGAVLNNNGRGSQTQLAGTINGNPYLARGNASVILNEVRSPNASRLNGTVEVAGQSADIIIANPSGLHVQGGGFINANRATLTTGQIQKDSTGNIDSINVGKGTIKFSNDSTNQALSGVRGTGDNRANYVDVYARAVDINGKVHARSSFDVV